MIKMNDEYKKMLERFEQICQNAKEELCGKKEKEQEKNFIKKIDKGLTISEYDEIEYWLANVEILDNTDYILNNRKAKILVKYLKEKQQETDRLNKEYERIYNENCKLRENHNINDITLLDENERLNRIIDNIFKFMQNKYDNSDLTGFTISFMELQDLKALKEDNK